MLLTYSVGYRNTLQVLEFGLFKKLECYFFGSPIVFFDDLDEYDLRPLGLPWPCGAVYLQVTNIF